MILVGKNGGRARKECQKEVRNGMIKLKPHTGKKEETIKKTRIADVALNRSG